MWLLATWRHLQATKEIQGCYAEAANGKLPQKVSVLKTL